MRSQTRAVALTCLAFSLAFVLTPAGPGQRVASGAMLTRKPCARAKLHHKKAGRCRGAVHAADTPTPVATPTSTGLAFVPPPIGTSTAPPAVLTPTVTPLPLPRFTVENNAGGVDLIVDNQTHIAAASGQYEAGDIDRGNIEVPFGYWYVWMVAQETNFSHQPYVSSPDDFQIVGSDGTAYQPFPGYPVDAADSDTPMDTNLVPPAAKNNGWLMFEVPARPDIFTVEWNEGGAVPFTAMGKFKIEAGVPVPGPSTLVVARPEGGPGSTTYEGRRRL